MDLSTFFKRKRFWLKDWYQGNGMWNDFKEIRFIYSNPQEGERIRERKLCKLLQYAVDNVPYYQQLKGGKLSLAKFPVVNKQIFLSRYSDFLPPVEKIPGQKGELHIQRTSGSTGMPFEVRQDTCCRTRRIATIKFGNELIGVQSFEPIVHFRALSHHYDFPEGQYIVENKRDNITYIDNSNFDDNRLRHIVDVINQKKARIIRGYTTALDTVSKFAVDNNLSFSSKPVFISGGEMMQETLRRRVAEVLGCKITSQYANEENGVFGQSQVNESGTTVILNRANCFIEILKMDSDEEAGVGELGRVVITDFTNYAMPMIRYDIGDVACIGERKEGILYSITNLAGRKSDMIYKTNGEYVDMYNNLPLDINYNPDINQWQFIQQAAKSYKLILSTSRLQNDVVPHFEAELKEVLGPDAEIQVVLTTDIPVLSSGKRKSIINEWKKS